MADENTATASKAAPKRKTAARKSPAAKTTAKRKVTARKSTARKTAPRRASRKSSPDMASRARAASRKAFLASLGFYGKAFDQVQEQFTAAQSDLEARRKKADKLYAELVKRGEKVEKQARSAINDIELPRVELDSLTDRKSIEARIDKARERFTELKATVGFKSAA